MTLAEIRASIAAKGYSQDSTTLNGLINSAYRRILGYAHWPFLQAQGTLTTTIGDPSVSLTPLSALSWIDSVRLTLGTQYYELEYMPVAEFRIRENLDRDNGLPQYWTEEYGAIHLYPRPDAAYTVTVGYIYTPPDLSDDAEVPIFDTNYHDLLVWAAVRDLAYRERDWNGVNFATAQYTAQLQEMVGEYGIRQRQNATQVARSDFWSRYEYG